MEVEVEFKLGERSETLRKVASSTAGGLLPRGGERTQGAEGEKEAEPQLSDATQGGRCISR